MATATYTPIATQTLGSAAASITFSSIPGTYTDLRLVLTSVVSVNNASGQLQFNSDTATNYSQVNLSGVGTIANSGNETSNNLINLNSQAAFSSTIPLSCTIDVFSYAGATNKTSLISFIGDKNGAGSVELFCGLWRSTAAITSLTLSLNIAANFNTGTIATLWGI